MGCPPRLMFGVTTTEPALGSTTPGTAMPSAVMRSSRTASLSITAVMAPSMAARTASGPPSRGVATRWRPRIVPDSSTSDA